MIPKCALPFHPMSSHRILYVGRDIALLNFLSDALKDCQVVRSPGCLLCLSFIESKIKYSLLLLDEDLDDTTGPELAGLARELPHRAGTPILILSAGGAGRAGAGVFFEKPDNLKLIAKAINRLLAPDTNAEG
jgi:DNA-binding response OmpR family regulator